MTSIEGALLDFKRLDRLAAGDTALHRLDPRAKVIVTLVFIVTVVSFGRYELSSLFPFFLFPATLIGLGNLPAGYLARKVALLCPFALIIGLFNPLFDRAVAVQLGPLAISGGWISCASIVIRAALTVGAAFVLLALTGFPAICAALERLGLPDVFVVQLHFLYRYIFVLGEEGERSSRALELRSFGQKRPSLDTYGSLVGHLLLRTWLRAEGVHRAMLARGFSGAFPTRKDGRFGTAEIAFVAGWSIFFVFLRFNNGAQFLGSLLTGYHS